MGLQPTFKLAYLLAFITTMACFTLMFLPLSIFIKIILVLSVLINAAYLILRDVLLALPHSWGRLS